MPDPHKYVGAPVRRVEDPRFLLGKARYVADIALPHIAEMALVRSSHAHARIKSIDTNGARRLPGVLAVFTGAEIRTAIRPGRVEMNPEKNPGHKPSDWYALTWDKVRHVGDPVAAVVAENRYIAEDATELVTVGYDPLPPIVDLEQALTDHTNLVHDEYGDNVLQQSDYAAGDPAAALAQAHLVLRERFRTNRHHAVSLEGRACLATFDAATKDLTLWTSNQMPHFVRTILADLLQHPENRTRVIAPDVGGGFGLKSSFFLEDALTAFAAMRVARPVRWVEDRYESFVASIHCKDEIVEAARLYR